MEDRLKKFVEDNREEFDVFEPRPELWQQICHDLPEQTPKQEANVINIKFGERASFSADFFFMRVAAAIVLLLGCGLTIFLMKQQTPDMANTLAVTAAQPVSTEAPKLNAIAPELPEIEAYYTRQIDAKKSQLSEYDLKVLGLDEQQLIDKELASLDSSYVELKKQLYTAPSTDEIVDAMVQNLWLRIKVLNRQLEVLQRLQQMNQKPNQEQQNDDTSNV